MHGTTALVILKYLAREGLLTSDMTTFLVPRYPQPVHVRDVAECFRAVAETVKHDVSEVVVTYNLGVEVRLSPDLYEKVFKLVFVNEKLFPVKTDRVEDPALRDLPLPALFVGSEKTQFRQIPLVETRPWPFKFLLELGGMLVCRSVDRRDLLLELRQFLNNHPQFEVKVDAKEWPDGSVAIFTWWFRALPKLHRRRNLNVP